MSEPGNQRTGPWSDGQAYERYMGRWSRQIAEQFLAWLDLPANQAWVDLGCGTGALTEQILLRRSPGTVTGVDPSPALLDFARAQVTDPRATFLVGDASSIPLEAGAADAVVSALAYNFFPDRARALAEMTRVARREGTVAFYVWDYPGGGMGFIDAFWRAANAVLPSTSVQAEAARFPFCTPETLIAEVKAAGLRGAGARAIDTSADFQDFEDLWLPFTRGTGPAPAFFAALDRGTQAAIRTTLEARVATLARISFPARAWAVRGQAP